MQTQGIGIRIFCISELLVILRIQFLQIVAIHFTQPQFPIVIPIRPLISISTSHSPLTDSFFVTCRIVEEFRFSDPAQIVSVTFGQGLNSIGLALEIARLSTLQGKLFFAVKAPGRQYKCLNLMPSFIQMDLCWIHIFFLSIVMMFACPRGIPNSRTSNFFQGLFNFGRYLVLDDHISKSNFIITERNKPLI